MDSMKALASLELVSARGLDTAGQGPELLSNSVRLSIKYYSTGVIMTLQFGSRMVKINKKRIDFILETEKLRLVSTDLVLMMTLICFIQEKKTGTQSKDRCGCLKSKMNFFPLSLTTCLDLE